MAGKEKNTVQVPKEDRKAEKTEAPAPKKSRKKMLALLAIGVALIGAVFGGGFFLAKTMLGKKGSRAETGKDDVIEQLIVETEDPHGAAKKAAEESAKKEEGHGDKSVGKEGKEGKGPGEESPFYFKLANPVRTNLNSSTLKVTAKVWFEATGEEGLKLLQRNEPHIMNALVLLFSGKTKEDVTTQAGIEQVNREIKIRVDQLVGGGKVKAAGVELLDVGLY